MTTNTMTLSEVRPGDLLFARSAGGVQSLTDSAGDTFRHVGLIADIEDGGEIIEVGRRGYRTRTLSAFVNAYEKVAVGQLDECHGLASDKLIAAARREMYTGSCSYLPTPALIVAGILSLARAQSASEIPIRWARRLALKYLENHPETRMELICSTFLVQLLGACCPEHPSHICLRLAKDRRSVSDDRSDRVAEHFALPDDIWRSALIKDRYLLAM